jgi:predicted cupin superfamily sugar epimerase
MLNKIPNNFISRFDMLPHPEGGWYKENYRSEEIIQSSALPERFGGDRNFSTAIYFLLEQGNFSGFHRIKSDECWHFYSGGALLVHIIHPNGKAETIRLSAEMNNPCFQYVVPANAWFASEPAPESEFCFVGCTVAPGFDFKDFELAKSASLCEMFPQHESMIKRLCRI